MSNKIITKEMFQDFDFDIRRHIMKGEIKPRSINDINVTGDTFTNPFELGQQAQKVKLNITIKFTIEIE